MRIAIDIDSTLHHYWDQFAEIARRLYGIELPYDEQVTWGVVQLDSVQAQACIDETHGEEVVLAATPYAGAVEAVRRWHDAGHFIHITTHRAAAAREATARWLERVGIPYDDLYCSHDKVTRCVELGIDLLVDDSPVNIARALDAGIACATLEHPWNRELLAERPEVLRAPDWPGLEQEIACLPASSDAPKAA